MPTTKFGVKSVYEPAPKWWRRLERAMLMAFIPATVTMIMSWKFEDELKATRLTLIISVGLVALIKGVGMMLSDGDDYVSTVVNTDESKGDVR